MMKFTITLSTGQFGRSVAFFIPHHFDKSHVATNSFVPEFLKSWTGTVEEGDIFMTNDPYAVSGAISHLNDILVVVPVFCDGERIAWTANCKCSCANLLRASPRKMPVGHVSDISGAVPGSLGVRNKDIFSDGLQVSTLCTKI